MVPTEPPEKIGSLNSQVPELYSCGSIAFSPARIVLEVPARILA
jgi:hypothetical protein